MALENREGVFPLDPDQRGAVESNSRVTLVNGSAGTGMTQVVVGRVAHLIRMGHDPGTITCLTTRGSVVELTRRLAEHPLVSTYLDELFVGDLCSFANSFLRSEGASALGIPGSYSLWPPSRCVDETVARWKESDRPPAKRSQVRRALEWHWWGRSFGRLGPNPPPWQSGWSAIVSFYLALKKSQRALDFSDVLLYSTEAMHRTGFSVGAGIRSFPLAFHRTLHLVVDQGEELKIDESDLLFQLAAGSESLLVACDPNQAMKDYQGSHLPEAMRLRFGDMDRANLRVNHVTTDKLSQLMVSLTRESDNLGHINQRGVWQGERVPQLLQVQGSLADMYVQCIEVVRLLIRWGLAPSDIALLYRRGNPVGILRMLLAHRDIPSRLLAQLGATRGTDGRAVVALLTVLLHPTDISALQVAAAPGFPNKSRALGRAQARQLGSLIPAEGPERWEELRRYRDGLREDDPDRRAVTYLLETMQRLENVITDPGATLERLVDEAEVVVEAAKAPSQRGYLDRDIFRLRRLVDATPNAVGESLKSHLRRLIDRWVLGHADFSAGADGVSIGNVAAAKGQRWQAVFLLDVQDGKIPGSEAAKLPDRLAREERLFYLAASRSTRLLYLCMPEPGSSPESQVSRLLTPLVNNGLVHYAPFRPARSQSEESQTGT